MKQTAFIPAIGLALALLIACSGSPDVPPSPAATSTPTARPGNTPTVTTGPQLTPSPTPMPSSLGLSKARGALATYQPGADARPVVNALLTDIGQWLGAGGDLGQLASALDDATPQNQDQVTAIAQDSTGDDNPDILVQIPITGLPLLVFTDQGDSFAGYALPADFAETLGNSRPVEPGLTLWGVSQSSLQFADLTGDSIPEILLTYLSPAGSGFHLQPIVFQWREDDFRPIFAAHLVNWAGEAALLLEPDATSVSRQQIVLYYPFLYADGFDHKMVNHPLGQQVWRWSEDAGRMVRVETTLDLERSGWSLDTAVTTADRLRWYTNLGEGAFRRGDYNQALTWYNQVLRLAAEEDWSRAPEDSDWVGLAAFRRAATLLLRGQPDESTVTGNVLPGEELATDGLAAMQSVVGQYGDDMLGQLAGAFLDGYGDGSRADAAARGVAAMQRVDLYSYFYEGEDPSDALRFPLDADGILYPGAGLAAYLNAFPAGVDNPQALRGGLVEAGFAIDGVERTDAGGLLVDLRLPDAPSAEGRQVRWTLVEGETGWRVATGEDLNPSFAPLALDRSAEWPVVGDFQYAPADPPSPPAPRVELLGTQVEPLATAARLSFLGWSPDGETLAYLEHNPDNLAALTPFPAGTLRFMKVGSGQVCDTTLVLPAGDYDRPGQLSWLVDDVLLVKSKAQLLQGTPCGDFTRVTNQSVPPAVSPDSSLSLGRSHRAQTEVSDRSRGILSLVTKIFNVQSGRVAHSVEWRLDERLGDLGLGGEWLTDSLFLIYEILDQGPLLIRIGHGVSQVALDLFGLPTIPSILGPEEVSLSARGAVVAGTQTYHLVLAGIGTESSFPALQLYHAETGQVKELPFKHTGWPPFSPNGRWLVLGTRPTRAGYQSSELWLRPVDPAASEAQRLANGDVSQWVWSPDWTAVAGDAAGEVVIFSVPDGSLLSYWSGGAYRLAPLSWSTTGQALALQGYLPNGQGEALFVVQAKP